MAPRKNPKTLDGIINRIAFLRRRENQTWPHNEKYTREIEELRGKLILREEYKPKRISKTKKAKLEWEQKFFEKHRRQPRKFIFEKSSKKGV